MAFSTGYANIKEKNNIDFFDTSNYHRLNHESSIHTNGYGQNVNEAATTLTFETPFDFTARGLAFTFIDANKRDTFIENKGIPYLKFTHEGFTYYAVPHKVEAYSTRAVRFYIKDLFIPHSVDLELILEDNKGETYTASDVASCDSDITFYSNQVYLQALDARRCVGGKSEYVEVAENDGYDGGSRFFAPLPWNNDHTFISGVFSSGSYDSDNPPLFDIGFFTNAVLNTTSDSNEGFSRMSFGFTRFKTNNDYGVSTPRDETTDTTTWGIPNEVRQTGIYMYASLRDTDEAFASRTGTMILHRDIAGNSPNEVLSKPLMVCDVLFIAAKDNNGAGGGDERILKVYIRYSFIDKDFYDSVR